MILTLHRRYPEGDHWEIDQATIGTIIIENGEVQLDMENNPIKTQIQNALSKPITYIGGLFNEEIGHTFLKTVDKNSDDYHDAVIFEMRRLNIEARPRVPALV
jgi:hypothetical protein